MEEKPYTIKLQGAYTVVTFPGKPSPEVLEAVKLRGLRWNRQEGAWMGRVDCDPVDKALRAAYGLPARPDAACWTCKDPNGFFRIRGPFAPVLCDACHALNEATRKT